MHKGKFYLVLSLSSVFAFSASAAKERVLRVQNSVRVGHDDNIYQDENDEKSSGYITDIINISGKLNFSSRTDAQIYWQPEFRWRFDADPEYVSYQTLYGQLNHAVSQRAFLTVSDSFRFQDKEGQSGGSTSTTDSTFYNNNLRGALNLTVDNLSRVNLGAGHELQGWSDSDYGGKTKDNDFSAITLNGSYDRELKPNTTHGILGLNYVDHEYEGSRGGYDSATFFVGADHNFSPNVTGNARGGFSQTSVDNDGSDSDSTTPYAEVGLGINPTARTSINGTLGYSIYHAENSYWNAQERLDIALGARHDLTGKISISTSLSYILSFYDSDYASGNTADPGDAEDRFFKWGIRGSYQLNRNNFIDAGYEFTTRTTDTSLLTEYDRNRVDIGWRLRL